MVTLGCVLSTADTTHTKRSSQPSLRLQPNTQNPKESTQESFRGGAVVRRISPVEHEERIRGREILTSGDGSRSRVDLGTRTKTAESSSGGARVNL